MKIADKRFSEIDEFDELRSLVGQTTLWHGTRWRNRGWVAIPEIVYVGILEELPKLEHKNSGTNGRRRRKTFSVDQLHGYSMKNAQCYEFHDGEWHTAMRHVTAITKDDFLARRPHRFLME